MTLTDWTDDELLAELRAAIAEADLVTDRQREAARAAFTWRTVDAELAELLHDSALEAVPPCAAPTTRPARCPSPVAR